MRIASLWLLCPVLAFAQADSAAPVPPAAAAEPKQAPVGERPAPPLGAEGEPLPEKVVQAPPPEAAPAVSIRTDGSGDVVEEYRQNGRLYLVKVRPVNGVPYTLQDTNGDGRLDQDDSEGPIRPVYYTLYEWN